MGEQNGVEMEKLRGRILEIVRDELSFPEITPMQLTVSFEEAGIDSADQLLLVIRLETDFRINIPDEEAMKFKGLGDVVDFVAKQLEAVPHG